MYTFIFDSCVSGLNVLKIEPYYTEASNWMNEGLSDNKLQNVTGTAQNT